MLWRTSATRAPSASNPLRRRALSGGISTYEPPSAPTPVNSVTRGGSKVTAPLRLVSTDEMLTRTGPPPAEMSPTGCQCRRLSERLSSVAAEYG
jgi:hypothetical protein